MTKKYEATYAGYVYDKPKTYWTPDSEMKSRLVKIDLKKNDAIEAGGLPIISDGIHAYIDVGDSHTAIDAISGMKKSICAFMPLIYILGRARENMIITDPQGELFNRTSGYLAKQGYNVKCLDFRLMNKDGYNILEYPARVYRNGDKDKGLMLLSDLVNIFAEKQKAAGKCDVFWPDTAAMYLNGTGAIMFESYPNIDTINISNWVEMNTENGVEGVKELVRNISVVNAPMINLRTVLAEPEKTLMSTLSTASSFLGTFIQNNKLAQMLSNSTFDVSDLCKEKTVLYIITDDTTTTCDTIVGIIISQIQSYLIDRAYSMEGGKLKKRVNFVLDEFASFPIPNIENALATHRSRNIRYYLCIQSIDGLKKRYDYYESLLSNCGNTLFMGSTEKELTERISEQCGRTQITSSGKEQPLISTAELMTLKKSWKMKEAIYFNLSESLRYCTELPSIESYNLGNYSVPRWKVNHPKVNSFTIADLIMSIKSGKKMLPFSESENSLVDDK